MASGSSTKTTNCAEIKSNAANWTLEGDAMLLGFMKNISENLEIRCNATTKNINRMAINLDRSSIGLGNATNKLLFLQNSKFVENRVQEDDETVSTAKKIDPHKEAKPVVDPIAAIKIAADNSLKMMNECYEQVSLDLDSDSEDDDAKNNNTVLRPKNPYANQQMPFLIGSREWKEKWHVGLVESDESDEEVDEGQYSESSQEESIQSLSSTSLPSNPPTLSESEGSIWGLQKQQQQQQLQAKRFNPTNNLSSDDEDVVSNKSNSKNANNRGVQVLPTSNLKNTNLPFPQEPPQLVFAPTSTNHRSAGLFDDDVVDRNANKKPTKIAANTNNTIFPQQRQHERKIVNLFDDLPPDDDEIDWAKPTSNRKEQSNDLFTESDDENKNARKSALPPVTVKKSTAGLFDDDFDFVPRATEKTKSRITNLFDDEPEDDYFDIILNKKEQPEHNKKKAEAFQPETPKVVTKPKAQPSVVVQQPQAPSKFVNLFDDKPPSDDEFEYLFKKSADKEKPELLQSKNLFDDNEEDIVLKKPTAMSVNTQDVDKISITSGRSQASSEKEKPTVKPRKAVAENVEVKETKPPPKVAAEKIVAPKQSIEIVEKQAVDHSPNFVDDLPPTLPPPLENEEDDFEVSPEAKLSPFMQQLFQKEPESNAVEVRSKHEKNTEKDISSDVKPNTQLTYGSVNLFDDVPPDDEVSNYKYRESQNPCVNPFAPPVDDDFLLPTPEPTVKSSNVYLIQEEPPMDDGFDVKPTVGNSPKKDKQNVMNKVHMFSSDTDMTTPTSSGNTDNKETVEKRPIPKKLNATAFKINVAALLPGAKLPAKQTPEIKVTTTAPSDVANDIEYTLRKTEDHVRSVSQSSEQASPTDDNPEILQSLSKTRAKIPIKRKPSTRRGRQALYQSSITEQAEQFHKESDEDATGEVSSSPLQVEEAAKANQQQPTESIASMLAKEQSKPPKLPSFFDDEDNDDDIFAQISRRTIEQTVDNVQPQPTPIIKKAAQSDKSAKLPVEGLATSSKSIHKRQEERPVIKTAQKSTTSAVATSKKQASMPLPASNKAAGPILFGDDWFPTEITHKSSQKQGKVSKKPIPDKAVPDTVNSFDDLFGGGGDADDLFPSNDNTLRNPLNSMKNSAHKLRGDSLFDIPDDDDFFTIPTSKKPPAQQPVAAIPKQKPQNVKAVLLTKKKEVKKPVGLFGSDEDDDSDDLFGGGGGSKSKKKVSQPTKSDGVKKKDVKPIEKKLFDDLDDDDDDDLFGSGSSKKASTSSTYRPTTKPERKTSMKTSAPAINDPLADLLK